VKEFTIIYADHMIPEAYSSHNH